jgi:hypothetical protein
MLLVWEGQLLCWLPCVGPWVCCTSRKGADTLTSGYDTHKVGARFCDHMLAVAGRPGAKGQWLPSNFMKARRQSRVLHPCFGLATSQRYYTNVAAQERQQTEMPKAGTRFHN